MVPWTHRTICNLEPCRHAHSATHSCLTLHHPIDYSLPGSSVHGIFQARILEQVAIFSSRESSWPRIKPTSPVAPALAGRFFTTEPPGKPILNPPTKRQMQCPHWPKVPILWRCSLWRCRDTCENTLKTPMILTSELKESKSKTLISLIHRIEINRLWALIEYLLCTGH